MRSLARAPTTAADAWSMVRFRRQNVSGAVYRRNNTESMSMNRDR
jgi:hypothetical protein